VKEACDRAWNPGLSVTHDKEGLTGKSGLRKATRTTTDSTWSEKRPAPPKAIMPACHTCGNEYDKSFTVITGDKAQVFDSFECTIRSLAPTCEHCHCRIIGHGVVSDGRIYCCVHCARQEGSTSLRDRELSASMIAAQPERQAAAMFPCSP
jgi:hypothetical protein